MKENIKIKRKLYNYEGKELPDTEEFPDNTVVLDIGINDKGYLERGKWDKMPSMMPTRVFIEAIDSIISLYNENIPEVHKEVETAFDIIQTMEKPKRNTHWIIALTIALIIETVILLSIGR